MAEVAAVALELLVERPDRRRSTGAACGRSSRVLNGPLRGDVRRGTIGSVPQAL